MKKFKGNTVLIILVVIFAVIAIAAIIVAVYFWQKNKKSENSTPATSSSTETATQPVESPKEVVYSFMLSTLGTLPNAEINYDLARSYMTDKLKSEYSGESWVPMFYKIQDGPTSVKFISENISGNSTTVRYDPTWGEMALGWAFILEKVNGKWLISEFRNDAQ
ncbi:hypothetical protein CO019_00390 [Candidatus Berkelbacteria bacterium CG_4_9_14_0_2_um_filter_42_30]|uniref:DUF4878 domain-containing protein n=2 Tax=Candidatus Berkelbacteria TaxID=1618330 RepID=A0A1J4RSQ0_9BACT|nr:MAG: hypothetical protein AUJ40_01995 [Candidatus Berkelbacteria bacterium CG1_02_42_45]PJC65886.1 MAG: hypothetical protein CO019_00390 [Candidatus Berkelbacteria bacterium CG_4_9_14_0_2_um_filter_42_30]